MKIKFELRDIRQFVFLLLLTILPLSADADAPTWIRIADDVDGIHLSTSFGSLLSPSIVAIRTSLKDTRLGLIRAEQLGAKRMNIKDGCTRSSAIFGINANFFGHDEEPLGLVVSAGHVYRPVQMGGNLLDGVLGYSRIGVKITERTTPLERETTEATQAGPLLLRNGSIIRLKQPSDTTAPRTVVCQDTNGRMILLCTSSHPFGISLGEIQKILAAQPFACMDALNFDGGGSSQCFLNEEQLREANKKGLTKLGPIDIKGRDTIPIALGVFYR